MKVFIITAITCLTIPAFSQIPDSSYLDLGRTALKNNFTQKISIKGKELEKFPFTNLSEAIRVWLFGNNYDAYSLAYVIDGNMVADVNLYSIHDIEEVSLIQNAQVQLNGAGKQKQLIVITTKKQKHKGSGIEVNAKTLMSEQVFVDDYESEKNLFHQYHVSAYRKTKKLNMGASAGFLHDVMPQAQIDHYFTRTPDQLERFQFNSYADVSMGNHILSVRVNGTRQNKTFEQTMNPGSGPSNHLDRYGNHFLYNAEAKLQSIVSDGFINELSVAYAASNNDFSNHYVHTSIPVQSQEAFSEITTNNVQARNTLRYTKHSGSWQFSPAVNFSYRYIRERLYHQLKISSGINPPQISQSISHGGASQFLLTPSVDVSFLNAFNINAGILGDLSNFKGKRIYPFASTSLDVIALAQKESRHSLKIFASYASAGHFYDQAYTMSDLVYNTGVPISTVYGNPISTSPADSSFYSIQAGTVLSLFQNKWQLSYHFDNRDFNALLVVPAQGGSSQVVYPEANSTSHRIQVSVRAIETNQVNWFTSLHANNLFTTVAGYSEFAPNDVEGDVFTETRSWTGGWNNRLTVKNFSLGFDLLAHVNPVIRIGNMVHENENIFALQHAFIGYKFHIRRVKHAEVFVSAKNIYQNEFYIATMDPRKYYGAGFKFVL